MLKKLGTKTSNSSSFINCPEDFITLRRHELNLASQFGTTYCCEEFFSKLTLAKIRFQPQNTDPRLENHL